MKRILLLATLLPIGLTTALTSCSQIQRYWDNFIGSDSLQTEEPRDTTKRLSLVFAGDLMQHGPQISAAQVSDGYDYTECFQYIRQQIEYADIAVGNFETTLAGPPYTGYPCFCAPDEFLRDVKAAGFDVMLTANNHCCDKGPKGIERTIAMMDSLGMPHLGTYVSPESRERQYPLLVEKNGIRLVLLNYTYGTNGNSAKGSVVNRIKRETIAADIVKAKQMNPDAIIACMHWGEEYHLTPNKEQRELADWLFSQGVDHIIGGHPHVVQPMEIRTDAQGEKHALAYSLGNFVSNQFKDYTVGGMLVHMELVKDSTTHLANCDYSLYYVTRPNNSGHKTHRVYHIDTPDSVLSSSEKSLRDKFATGVRKLFSEHNKGVAERR